MSMKKKTYTSSLLKFTVLIIILNPTNWSAIYCDLLKQDTLNNYSEVFTLRDKMKYDDTNYFMTEKCFCFVLWVKF